MNWKEKWICELGHPKYRVFAGTGSSLTCFICKKIEKSLNPKVCLRGHKYASEDRQCRLCMWYAQHPWLKELDTTGEAVCPRGHEVTHATLNYKRRGYRRCPECHKLGRGIAVKAMAEAHRGKPNANRGKRFGVTRTFADWVVVLRLIEGRLDEVYQMRRGTTKGPTPMEEWVAYNSTRPGEGAWRLAYSEQNELLARRHGAREMGKANELAASFTRRWEKWGTYGRERKWEPKTIWELIGQG